MEVSSVDEIVSYLREKRGFLRDRYGVTRIGIFGSFLQGNQNTTSDYEKDLSHATRLTHTKPHKTQQNLAYKITKHPVSPAFFLAGWQCGGQVLQNIAFASFPC